MAKGTIATTNNYRLFVSSGNNRPLNLNARKQLRMSMKLYGFLKSFPLSCMRGSHGKLVVLDGQHRLALAEELGLPVHYVIEDVDYDVAMVNGGQAQWTPKDYAMRYAAQGNAHYIEGLQFVDQHKVPLTLGFALLYGTTTFANIRGAFMRGTFVVKDRAWADTVASLYTTLTDLSREIKGSRFLEACMAVCRVDGFDPARLATGAKRCRDKLVAYATRDAYLDMLEDAYNFGRKTLFPLKIEALQAMRERNAAIH